jgi:tRNA A-37 threonylcarbamoyl transferase component Bud32
MNRTELTSQPKSHLVNEITAQSESKVLARPLAKNPPASSPHKQRLLDEIADQRLPVSPSTTGSLNTQFSAVDLQASGPASTASSPTGSECISPIVHSPVLTDQSRRPNPYRRQATAGSEQRSRSTRGSMLAHAAANSARRPRLQIETTLRQQKNTIASLPREIQNLINENFSNFEAAGTGKCGDVYKAIAPDGKQVCVKINKDDSITAEHEAMQALSSPRLCKSISHDPHNSPKMLVMEYASGFALDSNEAHDLFNQAPPIKQLEWVKNVLTEIDYMHKANYSHNDISTGNILLNKNADGELDFKIIDFGKTSTLDGVSHLGSPVFISPKTFDTRRENRSKEMRQRNDLFAVGICVATFFGDWQCIKVGEQRMGDFNGETAPIRLKNAYRNATKQGISVPNLEELAIPSYLRPVVEKLTHLKDDENASVVFDLLDLTIAELNSDKTSSSIKQDAT